MKTGCKPAEFMHNPDTAGSVSNKVSRGAVLPKNATSANDFRRLLKLFKIEQPESLASTKETPCVTPNRPLPPYFAGAVAGSFGLVVISKSSVLKGVNGKPSRLVMLQRGLLAHA